MKQNPNSHLPNLPDWVDTQEEFELAERAFAQIQKHSVSLSYCMFLNEVEKVWEKGWSVQEITLNVDSNDWSQHTADVEIHFDGQEIHHPYPGVDSLGMEVLKMVGYHIEADLSKSKIMSHFLKTPITPHTLDECRLGAMGSERFARFTAHRLGKHIPALDEAARSLSEVKKTPRI